MKLPLDNFQVLGASPGSSLRNVLIILERKLERCDYAGFSVETMNKRQDLLLEYSKPLLDIEKRNEFEKAYQYSESKEREKLYLSVPGGFEIAGLLLLLEARLFDECLSFADDLLAEVDSESRRSKRIHADIYLVIGYASLEYGRDLKSKRYYDYCATILENGLLHLQGAADHDLSRFKTEIQKELEEITPFRILDLVSRGIGENVREVGIELLNEFVLKRGGLDSESDLWMSDGEFKSFFRQVRYYLTVQEQIDLYQNWCKSGSQSACFLHAIALVASGFARRKPERLVEALEVMQRLGSDELTEIMAYVSLLLGRIEPIDVADTQSSLPKEYNESKEGESSKFTLGQLCARCREWLEGDVLEGYRDLEADPDLEAYFSDRDVTSFIEERDAEPAHLKDVGNNLLGTVELGNRFLTRSSFSKKMQKGEDPLHKKHFFEKVDSILNAESQYIPLKNRWNLGLVLFMVGFLSFFVIVQKSLFKTNDSSKTKTEAIVTPKPANTDKFKSYKVKPVEKGLGTKTNRVTEEVMIQSVLSEWLNIKATVLSGQPIPERIYSVATAEAIKRLKTERKEDESRRQMQKISAKVINVKIIDRSEGKIEVDATLSYSDQRLDKTKNILEETPKQIFDKRYILVNNGSEWLIQ
ncbi:MAG: IMS domain-containing protein [Cyanobacteriota bacterium]